MRDSKSERGEMCAGDKLTVSGIVTESSDRSKSTTCNSPVFFLVAQAVDKSDILHSTPSHSLESIDSARDCDFEAFLNENDDEDETLVASTASSSSRTEELSSFDACSCSTDSPPVKPTASSVLHRRFELDEAQSNISSSSVFSEKRKQLADYLNEVERPIEVNDFSVSSGVASVGSSLLSLESVGHIDLHYNSANMQQHSLNCHGHSSDTHETSLDSRDTEAGSIASYRRVKSEQPSSFLFTQCINNNPHQYSCRYCHIDLTSCPRPIVLEKATQTDFTDCACARPLHARTLHLHKPIVVRESDDRRESGYSSISSQSRSPGSLDGSTICYEFTPSKTSNEIQRTSQLDPAKERLLREIKRTKFEPDKELLMRELKRTVNGQSVSSSDDSVFGCWTPLLAQNKRPLKGVLKNGFKSNKTLVNTVTPFSLDCFDSNASSIRDSQAQLDDQCSSCRYPPDKQKPTDSNKRIPQFVDVIQKVRLCLDASSIDREHLTVSRRKSRSLMSPKLLKKQRSRSLSPPRDRGEAFPPLHRVAACGDLSTTVDILQRNVSLTESKDANGWPAVHRAFQHGHLRTACLLIEAGADMREYTRKRVNEYKGVIRLFENTKRKLIGTEV